MYCNEPRKSLSQQLLFEVPILKFHFTSALKYLYCYYNEYSVKQTISLYLKLPLKPLFIIAFLYFWKDGALLTLNLFISEYLCQILPWKEIKEEVFSVKLQTENLCFCLR